MKYIKTYEKIKPTTLDQDIDYLVKELSYQSIDYIKEVIEYYKMTEEQIHNLRLAVQYSYLTLVDYRNVVGQVINSKREYPDRVWHYTDSERKFKDAYDSNFKDKIKYLPKPYQIARHKNHKLEYINELDSFNLFDIIGIIPGHTFISKFETKYLAGDGRYRNDKDGLTLWERYRNTDRESEFIKIWNESELVILTPEDIEYLEAKSNAKKYNL